MNKLLHIFPPYLAQALQNVDERDKRRITEIRLRVGKPVFICCGKLEYSVGERGFSSKDGTVFSEEDAAAMWRRLCRDAPYAFLEEQKAGYITVEGNRVGFCGAYAESEGEIRHIESVSSFCVRIMHEIKGCGRSVYPLLLENGKPLHTLIVSPPGCGKTTLLRDLIRLFSSDGFNVAIADERGEICAPEKGVPQLDVGKRSDVLAHIHKATAIRNMIRSLKPDVIAADELGEREDREAIARAQTQGVAVLATAHGRDAPDVQERLRLTFDRTIVLNDACGPGTICSILDRSGKEVRTCYA